MLRYLKPYWYYALLAPVFMLGEVSMDLLQPQLMKSIVDDGVLGLNNGGVGDMHLITTTGLMMIGLVLFGCFCGVMSGVMGNQAAGRFANDLRKDTFGHIMSLSFSQADRFSSGSLITRVTSDVTQVQNLVAEAIRGFFRTILIFAGGIFWMLQMDLGFGTVVLCALPVTVAIVVYFLRKITPYFSIFQEKIDNVNSVMQENVSGARVVKAYVQEDHERRRFNAANEDLVGTQLHVLLMNSYMMPLLNIVSNIAVVVVIKVGDIRVATGAVSPGDIMAAITYVTQILMSLVRMSMIFLTVSRGAASAKRLREVLDTEPAIRDGDGCRQQDRSAVQAGDGPRQHISSAFPAGSDHAKATARPLQVAQKLGCSVVFEHVSFSYTGAETVLEDINLSIAPGETIGILGSTGCGKSSLVNLIPRFYDATAGRVLVDGVDVRDYPVDALRDRIAIALQKAELFSTTIEENIRWGNPSASDADLERAARAAQAMEFIEARPLGMQDVVAQGGMSLSGGQKQRLSIARALAKKDAQILILDDATSALDLRTEAALYAALRKDYPLVTKIIIAQRIASVRDADRIVIIDGGTVAAVGSHEELLRTSDIYRDICRSQSRD